MSDKSTRSRERAGELDLPSILRAAPDRKRRLGLIRLCAKLGHVEAERWRQELGLQGVARLPARVWTVLSEGDRLELGCDCVEHAIGAGEQLGALVGPETLSTLRTLRRIARGAGLDEFPVQQLKASWKALQEEQAHLAELSDLHHEESGRDREGALLSWSADLALVTYPLLQTLGAETAEAQIDSLNLALKAAAGLEADAELLARGEFGFPAPWPEKVELMAEHRAWRRVHACDAYLWPEVVRP